MTEESFGLKWWRGTNGEWRAVDWYADDEEGQGKDGGGGGDKRGFDEVFREEVDGR